MSSASSVSRESSGNTSLTASLLKIEIVETDATLPSNVSFILHDDESVFENVGELFLTKSLDFESVQSYRFNVTVSDEDLTCDEPSSFFIDVENVNHNRPKFYDSLPVINVSENADFNVVIGTVEAYDEDEWRFGEIAEYRVSPSDVPFHISDSGEIKAIRSFDAESDDSVYRFAARACDGGGLLCADTGITVRIIDVNDFVAEFSSTTYKAKIGRLTESGSSVINVTAFDKDRDEPFNAVTYRIGNSANVSVPFAVDNRGHVITTAKMPNEAIVFAFNLVATHGGGAESEPVEIRISIVRQRDLPPRFSSPLELSVREDAQPGFQLYWFRIAAPIAAFPAIVRSDDVPSAFHLTPEGRLSLIAQ